MASKSGRRAVALLVAGAVALAGCGLSGPPVPSEVERLVEAKFPADGQIHVQSSGTFQIKPDTNVCRMPRTIDASLADVSPPLLGPGLGEQASHQSSGESGEIGEPMQDGTICEAGGHHIINHWALVPNRDGEPYKLVLAVWQGDPANGGALWVGGVERTPDTYLPCKSCFGEIVHGRFSGTGKDEPVRSSLRQDAEMLSARFVSYISRISSQMDRQAPSEIPAESH